VQTLLILQIRTPEEEKWGQKIEAKNIMSGSL